MMAATAPRAWLRAACSISRRTYIRNCSAILHVNYATTKDHHSDKGRVSTEHHISPSMLNKIEGDVTLPRKFYVNGTLRPDYTNGVFFVEPDNSILIDAIKEQAYILITGHRGSGKSTRCLHAIKNHLKHYNVIWTSLQGVVATTPSKFWESFGEIIKAKCKHSSIGWAADQTDIVDKRTFQMFFEYHSGKQIVFFIDEFDLLLSHPDASAELLDALRWMKEQRPDVYGLQSVIGIGPYNITRYSKKQLSPFNVSDHWDIPYFTRAQVIQLFKDFVDSCSVVLEPGIVDRIYDITLGHPGMVCWCGKAIQERLASKSGTLSLDKWMNYETFKLPDEMADGWQTVDKITEAVAEPKYSDFLITYILSNADGVLYDRRNPVHLELIGIGALTIKKKNIMVSSPLIRTILLKNVVSLKKYNIQILPIKDYLLDVPTLIRYIYQFDHVHMRNAPYVSYKQNQTSYADVKEYSAVPQEDVYQIEVHQLLKAALPSEKFSVSTKCNSDSKRNADIVVTTANKGCVVLELVAHSRDGNASQPEEGSVREHIIRCATHYAKIKDVRKLWVINFTTRRPNKDKKEDGYGYVWSQYDSVQVIHVWHDIEWTQAIITERTSAGYTTTPINLAVNGYPLS